MGRALIELGAARHDQLISRLLRLTQRWLRFRRCPIVKASFIIWQVSGSSSVVERDLAKVDVAGSTPVSRSIYAPA